MNITAQKSRITVKFDPSQIGTNPFSYELDGKPLEGSVFEIFVDKELAILTFRLTTVGGGAQAAFTTSPLQWLSAAETPVPLPPGLSVLRNSDEDVTVLDVNSVIVGQVDFPFEVGVVYKGKTYTSPDPTIINTPITGGPELATETRAASPLLIS